MKGTKMIKMEHYHLQIYSHNPVVADEIIRGVISIDGCESVVAFNGLFEFWKAIEWLRRSQSKHFVTESGAVDYDEL
jgi:hypothetical protein